MSRCGHEQCVANFCKVTGHEYSIDARLMFPHVMNIVTFLIDGTDESLVVRIARTHAEMTAFLTRGERTELLHFLYRNANEEERPREV